MCTSVVFLRQLGSWGFSKGFTAMIESRAPLDPEAFVQGHGVDLLDEGVIGKCCARTALCGASIDRQSHAASDAGGRLLTLRKQIC